MINGSTKVVRPLTTGLQGAGEPAAKQSQGVVELGAFLLSQSGQLMPGGYDKGQRTPLADPAKFDRVEIKALDAAGVGRTATFQLDDRGAPRPDTRQPALGNVPFQLTLIGKDGERYSGVVDITPKKLKVSHTGFESLSNVKLTLEAPPAAPPPQELALGKFMITQSGNLMPEGYGNKPVAMFPPGFTDHVEVMALDPSGVHRTARFDVDDRGMIQPDPRQPPLGHVPYRLTAKDKDGNAYSADIDVTPSKIKVSHTGYETLSNIKLQLQKPAVVDEGARALDGVAADFAAKQAQPKSGMSAFALMLKR